LSSNLVELPWQVQLALAAGYIGYCVAYAGRRQWQSSLDVAMISLVFSVPASSALYLLSQYSPMIAGSSAALSSVLSGVIWRAFGYDVWFVLQRKLRLSTSTGQQSTWAITTDTPKRVVSQLCVTLTNGRKLFCNDAGACAKFISAPIILGVDGGVSLVVTHIKDPGEELEEVSPNDEAWGVNMTYIPQSQIREVDIRTYAP